MEEITVTGENIESFIDAVIESAKAGYVRVDTMELSSSVVTNYWRMTMARSIVEEVQEVEKTGAKRTQKAKE